jgi:gamma-glutamyl-gamma-aminobutyrate hydrolase PuuD
VPRIGITISSQKNIGWYADYFDRVREHGGEPVALDPLCAPEATVAAIDGLLLSGGADVTPEYYGASPHPTVKSRPDLDHMEVPLARVAIAQGLPILGICRGHQLLNVAAGGRLLQHIESRAHEAAADRPGDNSSWHQVRLDPASRLAQMIGRSEIEVNSRHHQAVLPEMVAPGLAPVAWTEDGLVEALEWPGSDAFFVSVQWHPERPETRPPFNATGAPIFAAFIQAARDRS